MTVANALRLHRHQVAVRFWHHLEAGPVDEERPGGAVEHNAVAVAVERAPVALAVLVGADEAGILERGLDGVRRLAVVVQIELAAHRRNGLRVVHVHR